MAGGRIQGEIVILAIDTSSSLAQICLWDTGTRSPRYAFSWQSVRAQTVELARAIQQAWAHSAQTAADMDLVAVCTGPGSYTGVRIGLHICRGNWSRDESTLLSGSYQPLAHYLKRLHVRQLVLEYATGRAGDVMSFGDKELGLGVVNPRTNAIETVGEIVDMAERALEFVPADRLFLNPDCGFGTFSNRPINESGVASRKLEAIVQAAALLRSRHG